MQLELDEHDIPEHLRQYFEEVQPSVVKEKSLAGIPWRVALALQADGWILRSEIIWYKLNPMPESVQDRPTRAHEQVFLLSKGAHYFYDALAIQEKGTEPPRAKEGFAGESAVDRKQRGQNNYLGSTGMRNSRSVLSLASEPCHFGHFGHYATMPTALVDKCLRAGSSQHGVCSAPGCGKPWVRIVERQRLLDGHIPVTGAFSRPDEPFRIPPNGVGHYRYSTQTTEHGWRASCGCGAPVSPAVVFDPFCGSGTTLEVARRLGRHGVGTDLSLPYLRDIARTRLGLEALAAWEGRNSPQVPECHSDLPLFAGGTIS